MVNSKATNLTYRDGDGAASALALRLERRAHREPDRIAFALIEEHEDRPRRMTFRELDRRARQVSSLLHGHGVADRPVVLALHPGLEYVAAVWGCFYAGATSVPAYPDTRNRHGGRLRGILEDLGPHVVLEDTPGRADETPASRRLLVSDADGCDESAVRPARTDAVALIQYTSGTTRAPRGVAITQGNVIAMAAMLRTVFDVTEHSTIVSWLPPFHDMGFIGTICEPVFAGAKCTLLRPTTFTRNPLSWLSTISSEHADISGGPDFGYDLCLRKITEEQKAGLNLSGWRVAFNGAEPVRADTLERFSAAFACCGFRRAAFRPCYGLAENTLLATATAAAEPLAVRRFGSTSTGRVDPIPIAAQQGRLLVGCGRTPADTHLRVVDPATRQECGLGEVGEIWLRGPGVARGYWRHRRQSVKTFRARIKGDESATYLRTGDLGFQHEGHLFIAGRRDDMLQIRGRSAFSTDIEAAVRGAVPAADLGGVAAWAMDVPGDPQIAVAIELRNTADLAGVAARIRVAIGRETDVWIRRALIVRSGTLPRTSSGKMQRSSCVQQFAERGNGRHSGTGVYLDIEWPETSPDAEQNWHRGQGLLERLRRLSGQPLIGSDTPVEALGLDSLAHAEVMGHLERACGHRVAWQAIVSARTVGDLVALDESGGHGAHQPDASACTSVDGISESSSGLSCQQQAAWVREQLSPSDTSQYLVSALRISPPPPVASIQTAIYRTFAEAPMLTARFDDREDGVRQLTGGRLTVDFKYVDLRGGTEEDVSSHVECCAYETLDLNAHSSRVHWIQGPSCGVLVCTVHHLVADAWSLELVMRRLAHHAGWCRLATGDEPARHYFDFVKWQREWLQSAGRRDARAYWGSLLSAGAPCPLFGAKRTAPQRLVRDAERTVNDVDARTILCLQSIAAQHHTSVAAVTLSVFQLALAAVTSAETFCVGIETAGRTRDEFMNVVGLFANPIPLLCRVNFDESFGELVRRTAYTLSEGLERQDYPFSVLVRDLNPSRRGHTPLFDVAFNFYRPRLRELRFGPIALGVDGPVLGTAGREVRAVALAPRHVHSDLAFTAVHEHAALRTSVAHRPSRVPGQVAREVAHTVHDLFDVLAAGMHGSCAELYSHAKAQEAASS